MYIFNAVFETNLFTKEIDSHMDRDLLPSELGVYTTLNAKICDSTLFNIGAVLSIITMS